jgi:hypothetical protein
VPSTQTHFAEKVKYEILIITMASRTMEWLDTVETLEGTNEDGEDRPLLTEFDDDPSRNSLLRRVDKFLKSNEPSVSVIAHVRAVYCATVKSHCTAIASMWSMLSQSSVDVPMQRAMIDTTSMMLDKCRFLCTIHRHMLENAKWISLQTEIYKSVNVMMLEIIKHCQNYPHKPKDRGTGVIKHFETRDFLATVCQYLYDTLFPESDYFGTRGNSPGNKLKLKFDLELLIPTMRRLGMMDCLDKDWNVYGDWSDILQEMEKYGKHVPHTIADKILNEKSFIWRNSRNSMRCRTMRRPAGMSPPSQCYQYFPKCTVMGCSNIETPAKPHKMRCIQCYYFHVCSPACESYADMFGVHKCSQQDREKAPMMRSEMELYLKQNDKDQASASESCNFCFAKEKNMPEDEKMMRCGGCASVWYCSKQCQQWDWTSGKHNLECKK